MNRHLRDKAFEMLFVTVPFMAKVEITIDPPLSGTVEQPALLQT
jgi:hypothetical protein